jgi:hypothetical protein
LLSWYKLPQFAAASCILFGVLAGVTFTLSTQLVRQYIASSILFLFFVTILEARYHFAVFLFILGILIHNTFILPAMFLTMCCLIWRQPFVKRHLFWTIAILPALGYLLGEFIASEIPASAFSNAITLDDGSISVSAYIFDGALFLLIMFGLLYQKDKHQLQTLNTSATVVLFLAVWAGLMYGARDVSIFSLRFYFYIEWFRVIGIISVVQLIVFRWKQEGLVFFVIPFALLILGLRVHYSPWDYGGDVLDHLFGSISWWVDRLNQSLNQI